MVQHRGDAHAGQPGVPVLSQKDVGGAHVPVDDARVAAMERRKGLQERGVATGLGCIVDVVERRWAAVLFLARRGTLSSSVRTDSSHLKPCCRLDAGVGRPTVGP